jgi:hypothetical protein
MSKSCHLDIIILLISDTKIIDSEIHNTIKVGLNAFQKNELKLKCFVNESANFIFSHLPEACFMHRSNMTIGDIAINTHI